MSKIGNHRVGLQEHPAYEMGAEDYHGGKTPVDSFGDVLDPDWVLSYQLGYADAEQHEGERGE